MQSQLLRYCREKHGFSFAKIADKIGITSADYMAVENGEKSLDKEQAQKLAELYKINGTIYYYEALQNHHLETFSHVGENPLNTDTVRSSLLVYLREHLNGYSKSELADMVHISEEFYEAMEHGTSDPDDLLPTLALRRISWLFRRLPYRVLLAEYTQVNCIYQIAKL